MTAAELIAELRSRDNKFSLVELSVIRSVAGERLEQEQESNSRKVERNRRRDVNDAQRLMGLKR